MGGDSGDGDGDQTGDGDGDQTGDGDGDQTGDGDGDSGDGDGDGDGIVGPVPVGQSWFDHEAVYVMRFYAGPGCSTGGPLLLSPVDNLNFYQGGFDCEDELRLTVVGISGGSLYFRDDDNVIRRLGPEFVGHGPDDDTFEWEDFDDENYNPRANDPVVPTPECEEVAFFIVNRFGNYLYACSDDVGVKWDQDGNRYEFPGEPLSFGAHNLVFVSDSVKSYVIELGTPGAYRVRPWPLTVTNVRAHEDGFLATAGEPAFDQPIQLFFVDHEGNAELLGEYPVITDSSGTSETYCPMGDERLAADGSLYSFGSCDGIDNVRRFLYRRTIEGVSEIVASDLDTYGFSPAHLVSAD